MMVYEVNDLSFFCPKEVIGGRTKGDIIQNCLPHLCNSLLTFDHLKLFSTTISNYPTWLSQAIPISNYPILKTLLVTLAFIYTTLDVPANKCLLAMNHCQYFDWLTLYVLGMIFLYIPVCMCCEA